ncbi:NUDIX hydrolase [Halotalea alkalilenta]|uniref:NUDIX hydrolase n=1 Tax=Halotalea alkalilenta TaxID=376489 RepID=UPI000483EF00|nr:NUDIX hydrolase [Halotalea alkalilenta]
MNFCSHCGARVERMVPEGDDRERYVCPNCATVHYQNPRIVAGTLINAGSRVLLCRRAITPRRGYWTLPAGFMENAETTFEAAIRETREEACAEIGGLSLYALFDLPHIDQVYMIFRGELRSGYAPGPESLDVALFEEHEVPWDELSFPTVEITLRYFYTDRRRGEYPLHRETIARPPSGFFSR